MLGVHPAYQNRVALCGTYPVREVGAVEPVHMGLVDDLVAWSRAQPVEQLHPAFARTGPAGGAVVDDEYDGSARIMEHLHEFDHPA